MKGIIHVHTKEFSYDGKVGFQEIKIFCKKMDFSFVALTEHSESMNKDKMEEFVRKCKEMSDEEVLFIPGLEFLTNEGYEVLGVGVKNFLQKNTLEETIKFIRKNKGIAILAHPCKYKNFPANLDVDGIEILNFEYDGFFPCLKSLKLLKEFRKKNKNVFGIFGLDIHRKIHFRNIFVELNCKKKEDIIPNLKKGYFLNKNLFLSLRPQNNLNKISKTFCFFGCKSFNCLKKVGVTIFKFLRKIKIIK
jgi:hypothetical protein